MDRSCLAQTSFKRALMSLGNLSMTPTSAIAEGFGVGDLVILIVVGPICYGPW